MVNHSLAVFVVVMVYTVCGTNGNVFNINCEDELPGIYLKLAIRNYALELHPDLKILFNITYHNIDIFVF